MTKKDLKAVAVGSVIGSGLFFAVWYFLRKKSAILELNPTAVKWEGR